MNQPESPGILPESETRYRIAHLSDLHFGRHFNTELWCYLEGLLQHEYRRDLIVVTGDIVDTPTLFGLGIAYRQLVELQQNVRKGKMPRSESGQEKVGLDCQLLFVPGNHDVGILGNVALWPWRGKVRLVFHKEYRYHFARLPTFIEHRNKLWWKRWCNRVAWICRFAGKRGFAWTKYLGADGTAGYDLRLMSAAAPDSLVNEGRTLVIVALVGTDLHIRIFDASGKKIVDKAENELVSGETLTALKKQLTPIPDESGLSKQRKQKIIRDATSIAGHTRTAWLTDPGPEDFPLIVADPEVSSRVVIAGFDSNEKLRLATGRVDSDRILSLEPELHNMRESRRDRSLCPRIALVHHHPLPIAYSDAAEAPTAFEPFLVFRNAGTFLHALARLNFDLVLHGHKHYWHFARLSFDAPGSAASELVVIGAGSGTINLAEPGRNSFNVIDVMPNGSVTHRPVFYGQGMTIVGASRLDMRTEPKQLFSLDTIKSKAHSKGVIRQSLECDLIERSIDIDENGAADLETTVHGLRVRGERRLSKVELMIKVAIGRVVPAGVELTETSKCLGHILGGDRHAPPTKELLIPINLGYDVYSNGEGVNYGVTCRMINTFSITRWENEQLPEPGATFAHMMIRHPAKRLRLAVTLPAGWIEPSPEVVCERIKSYPLIDFDEHGFVNAEGAEWARDQEMTQHEQDSLKRTACNTWTVEINEPMVGFRYDLRWRVKTGSEAPLHLRGQTDQLQRSLLSLLDDSLPDKLAKVKALGQRLLDDAFQRVLYPVFHSTYAHDERLVAAIFVYDPRRQDPDRDRNEPPVLRLLYESRPGWDLPGRCEEIPLNEGITGTAFKVRDLCIYVLPELRRRNDGAYVYYPDGPPARETDRFSVLVALPLYLGRQRLGKDVSPEEVVGVFTLGSNARDSGLLALVRQSDSVASDLRSRRPPRSPASAQQAAEPNIAAVAMANKIVRVIRALLRRGEAYRAPIAFDTLFTVALGYIRALAAALRVEDRGKNPDNTGPVQLG